jgi:hypothetical protein
MISWATLASDYTIYLDQSAPNSKVFLFAYSGFLFPNVICEMVGAAFAVSMHAPGNEAWLNGYKVNNVGGLLDEVMRPAGGFGKFCIVLLALSCIAASSEFDPFFSPFILSFEIKVFDIRNRSMHVQLLRKLPMHHAMFRSYPAIHLFYPRHRNVSRAEPSPQRHYFSIN